MGRPRNHYFAILAKFLKKITPSFVYTFLYKIYAVLSHKINQLKYILRLISSYINYIFKSNKKIEKLNCDLILISQIQRSGGTLISQLLDGSEDLHSYPSELVLTRPKNKWFMYKNLNFNTLSINSSLKQNYIDKNYYKLGGNLPKTIIKNTFLFNPILEKKIFLSINKNEDVNLKNLRYFLNSYFTSFFNSFLNYKNLRGKKKFICAFLPGFTMYKKNVDMFFTIYNQGFIISIIRDPESWLISAKTHSEKYQNIKTALNFWLQSFTNSLELKKKYKEKIILLSLFDLINHTKKMIDKLCMILNIKYQQSMLVPTFNGNIINSNSSIKSSSGKIDKNVLKRKYHLIHNLSNEEKKMLSKCKRLYKRHQKLLSL